MNLGGAEFPQGEFISPEENPTDVNIRRETLKAAVISTLYHDSQEQPKEE